MDGKSLEMERRPEGGIRYRLSDDRATQADIRLRRAGVRWISVSHARGREVTGIGPTARAAVVASLDWMGPAAVRGLLVDLRLLDVSVLLAEATAG